MSKRFIVSSEVIVETGGITITRLRLSEEAEKSLAVPCIRLTVPAPEENSYWLRVQEGDFVRLPNGKTGTVYMIERNDLFKIVSVRLDAGKRRWFGLFPPIPARFADDEINQLELIATKADMDAY